MAQTDCYPHLHLTYQEVVTHKRVVAWVILKWVFSAYLTLIFSSIPRNIKIVLAIVFGVVYFYNKSLLQNPSSLCDVTKPTLEPYKYHK